MSVLKGSHVRSLALPLVSLKGPIKRLSAIHITFCGMWQLLLQTEMD